MCSASQKEKRDCLSDELVLVEWMGARMACEYLSDLHNLSEPDRKQLARKIGRLDPADYTLCDWNEALAYLTECAPEGSAAEAKEKLIAELSR